MSKKVILGSLLVIVFSFTGLVAHQSRVFAWAQTGYPCSVGGDGLAAGCQGFYTGVDAPIYTCPNSPAPPTRPCFSNAGDLLPAGLNVNSTSALIAAVDADLRDSGNEQNYRGAAFIIDNMMGIKGPTAVGWTDAINAESGWEQIVNYFNGTHPGYTVNWNYEEDCANSSSLPNSGYFSNDHDDRFHNFICQYQDAGLDDGPTILFQWSGGDFSIGKLCGNVQGYLDKLPSIPPSPTGKITVTCNPNASQFTAAVTFGDANGYATTGSISTTGPGGTYNTAVTSGNSYPIPTKDTSPTISQIVTLTVTDQGTNTNYTAPTPVSPPCQPPPKPTGKITITCDQNTSQFVAAVTFGDSNGYSTTGKISTGSWPGETVVSGKSYPIPQSATNPYTKQPVTLTVTDQGTNTNYTNQTNVPCVNLACGSLSVTPSTLDPYTTFSATVTVTNDVNMTPPGATFKINISPSGGTSSGSQPDKGSGSTSTATFSNLGPTGGPPGAITATWTLTAPGLTITCKGNFQVADQPYLKVYGGDVMIGASPTYSSTNNSSSCAPNPNGGIYSWNSDSPKYFGAGTEYAVQALGQIEGFASAQSSTSSPPTDLSFANTGVNTTSPIYGGSFGASTEDCDFTSDLVGLTPQPGSNVNPPNNVSGVVTIYATGDVYISNNILYCIAADTTAKNTCPTEKWANPSQIPYFKLVVVGGNIFIDHNVTELDGLYVAEPKTSSSGSVGGTIYTCATKTPLAYSPFTIGNYFSTCSNQLNIYGSFIAQQVQFLRTFGSVGNDKNDKLSSSNAAEVFDYTPEMWLPRSNTVTNNGYSAITSLPPVL